MKQQRGVAIIAVLIVVAIIAGLASSAMFDQQLLMRRAENQLHGNQAILHMISLETWAKEVLLQDLEDDPNIDHAGETWATRLVPVAADGGVVAGKLEDLAARFNLNTLVDNSGQPVLAARNQLTCLLQNLASEELDPQAVVSSVIDWIDVNQDLSLNGAEDLDYLSRDPAYRTASRMLASTTELRLIKGMTTEGWEKIAPFVTALPDRESRININTAPLEVVQCIHEKIDESLAQQIISERESETYYESWEAFRSRISHTFSPEDRLGQDDFMIDFTSRYFLLQSSAGFGEIELNMQHLIARDTGQQSAKARTVMRAFGNNL